MVKPLHEQQVNDLPMSGGSLTVVFENREDLEQQRSQFLPSQGLFIKTTAQPKPFCEFQLTLRLPTGDDLDAGPARLVQLVPYGEPGMMLQLMRMPPTLLSAVDSALATSERVNEPATEEPIAEADDFSFNAEPGVFDDGAMDESQDLAAPIEDAPEKPLSYKERKALQEREQSVTAAFTPGSSRVDMLEKLRKMTPNERQRLAKQANRTVRSILMRDTEASVVFFLLKNPQITKQEVIEISKLPAINHNAVKVMLSNKQWSNSEELRYNLVRNPKTPVSIALKLVGNLNMKHLRELAKDWGIKTQIKQHALRLVVQRTGGA